MSLPLNKRDFDLFLSHAHKDHEFVQMLYKWLVEKAGLSVWYDARELAGGALLATDLQRSIERCRGILVIASGESLSQGWVNAEYNAAMDERANVQGFRVVALRLGTANVENLMRGTSWISVPDGQLNQEAAFSLLSALYPSENSPNPATARDVYVSCSWHEEDCGSARLICRTLIQQGFRLIGDAMDQKGFDAGNRIERIIASCGAFVCVIPYRDSEQAITGEKPYKYFLSEIDIAARQGLPMVVIADSRVRRKGDSDDWWHRLETNATECSESVRNAVIGLWEDWRMPSGPHYIFCASEIESDALRATGPIRHLIERVTGMRTIIGDEIHEEPLQSAIVRKVSNAFVVLADITNNNINTCIEAGMGLAAGASVELIAQGESRRPPFMLRTLQMPTYKDDVEQIGIIHKVIRPYRRRIINSEIVCWI